MVARITTDRVRRRDSGGRVVAFAGIAFVLTAGAFVVGRGQSSAPLIQRETTFVSEFDVVEVPVPERPVPAGTLVRDITVRIEKFPSHQLPSGAVRDLGLFRDSVALVALPGGLPIVDANIGNMDESTNGMVGKIPPGMRAMAVKVDATGSVEGWARTGSIVDVLLVEKNRTIVVAERVRVLSTERSTSPIEEHPGAPIPSTVTLLVTQEQCLAINTAAPLGKIAFALRSGRDGERWRDTEFSSDDLSSEKGSKGSSKIAGMATFRKNGKDERFALVDGSWIPADGVPETFRPSASAPVEGRS
jgi:Flp pilus assembly protein CpaB